jgi:hypothetical protein
MKEIEMTGLSTGSEATTYDTGERCKGDPINIGDSAKGVMEKPVGSAEKINSEDSGEIILSVRPAIVSKIETLSTMKPKRIKEDDSVENETLEPVDPDDIGNAQQADSKTGESGGQDRYEILDPSSLAKTESSNDVDLSKTVEPVEPLEPVKPDELRNVKIGYTADTATLEIMNHAQTEMLKPKASAYSETENSLDPDKNKVVKSTVRVEALYDVDLEDQKPVFLDIDRSIDDHVSESKSNRENSKLKMIQKHLKENLKHLHIKHHKVPENPNFIERLQHSFLLPPHGPVADHVTLVLMILTLWITW